MSWERSILDHMPDLAVDDLPLAVVSAVVKRVARSAKDMMIAAWPVATGTSLAGWRVERSERPDHLLVNRVEYAEHVHSQPEYGGPPGLADRTWDRILPMLRQEYRGGIAEQRRIQAERAARGRRGRRTTGADFQITPSGIRSAAPPMRTFVDPLESAALRVPPRVLAGAVVPSVAGAPAGARVAVVSRTAARIAESLMQPHIRAGEVDSVALQLIRAGRLQDASDRLIRQGQHRAAATLRGIIQRQGLAA